mgnify:FL=1
MKRLLALFLSRALPAFGFEQSPNFQIHGNHQVDSFPLKSSHSEISITGPIAQVELTQTYTNDGDQPIDATYNFPASTKSAVHGMTMKIGDRTIVAEIQENKKLAKSAKSDGSSTSVPEPSSGLLVILAGLFTVTLRVRSN